MKTQIEQNEKVERKVLFYLRVFNSSKKTNI